MPQFFVGVYDQPETRTRPMEEMTPIYEAVDVVNQKAVADGIFVFAAGLNDQKLSKHVDARGGKPIVTDGPYVETKEYLGGFWVIEVADMDAALAWASEATVACQAPLDVRELMAPPE